MDSVLHTPGTIATARTDALDNAHPDTAPRSSPRADRSERFPLVVHCHLRWDFVWQRPQQLFSRLAEHHAVLFVEDPLPTDASAAHLDISEPHPNVVRMVPRLPHDAPQDVDAQWHALLPLMEQALARHPLLAGRFDDAVQWFYSPMSAPVLLGAFGARGTVYDCMDELANFRFAPPDIAERERFLLARADVVYTGGYQLYQEKSRHHATVHFHGCGVDAGHFGRARVASTVVPEQVASLPGPVLGYVGVIDERLDYELIEALALRFPDASVAMAGPVVKVDPADLPRLPNIHWLGQQAYEQLPALVKGFDVCLMPFALNDATRYINPTKTLEYMATGKPVVSTAVADVVRNFTPVVDVAHSTEGFLDAVARAVEAPDPAHLREGIARAMAASWDSTVATMRDELLTAVRPVRAARGAGR
ncbi:glycosyltransferase [Luteimonas sp. SDU82]|uniref:glycosyltransferase n=1 Tax=Luteimonas sp. SDU82 TaxID=3422592 RepID=UPI003EB982CE